MNVLTALLSNQASVFTGCDVNLADRVFRLYFIFCHTGVYLHGHRKSCRP